LYGDTAEGKGVGKQNASRVGYKSFLKTRGEKNGTVADLAGPSSLGATLGLYSRKYGTIATAGEGIGGQRREIE